MPTRRPFGKPVSQATAIVVVLQDQLDVPGPLLRGIENVSQPLPAEIPRRYLDFERLATVVRGDRPDLLGSFATEGGTLLQLVGSSMTSELASGAYSRRSVVNLMRTSSVTAAGSLQMKTAFLARQSRHFT